MVRNYNSVTYENIITQQYHIKGTFQQINTQGSITSLALMD